MATENTALDESFNDIIKELTQFRLGITRIQMNVRHLETQIRKEIRKSKKLTVINKSKKQPSGFAKATSISPELCNFMKKPIGDKAPRTEVTQYIIQYIKDKSLQNNENKKEIIPDKKLASLLNCGKQPVTYFTIQKFMNKHFISTQASISV